MLAAIGRQHALAKPDPAAVAQLPPFGAVGAAIDGLALHRVAEASVLRFVSDIARYLGETLRG